MRPHEVSRLPPPWRHRWEWATATTPAVMITISRNSSNGQGRSLACASGRGASLWRRSESRYRRVPTCGWAPSTDDSPEAVVMVYYQAAFSVRSVTTVLNFPIDRVQDSLCALALSSSSEPPVGHPSSHSREPLVPSSSVRTPQAGITSPRQLLLPLLPRVEEDTRIEDSWRWGRKKENS